jgi:protein SCO1
MRTTRTTRSAQPSQLSQPTRPTRLNDRLNAQPSARSRTRSGRLIGGAAVLAVAALTLTACGASPSDDANGPVAQVSASATSAAVVLDQPFSKPNLVLTDSQGKPFDLVKETAGRPTLLYFGYTHCPDVCPTTMAAIADAKSKLPAAERAALRVVFVSTDPTRDTPKRLAAWLGAQDPSFIGLTGKFAAIQAAARSLGVMVEKPVKEKDGSYSVEHGAEVFAFSPKDDKAHFLYTAGVSAAQFQKDLPALIKGETP